MKKSKSSATLSSLNYPEIQKQVAKTLNSDWLNAHKDVEKPKFPRTAEIDAFFGSFWPAGESYFSPVQCAFFIQFISLSLFNQQPFWIMRDGLIPLLWFFKTHPRPTGIKSRIYVHESLTNYVPKEWQEITGSYHLKSTSRFGKSTSASSLLLTSVGSEIYCGQKALADNLKLWAEQRPEIKLTDIPKLAFLPYRHFGGPTEQTFHPNLMIQLCKAMGTDIRATNWNQMQSTDSWENFYILDLNDGMICSDSYFVHFVLARGAQLWKPTEADPSAQYISLSPYHRFEINDSVDFTQSISFEVKRSLKETTTFTERHLKAVYSEANQILPWPKWFSSWAQDLGSQ